MQFRIKCQLWPEKYQLSRRRTQAEWPEHNYRSLAVGVALLLFEVSPDFVLRNHGFLPVSDFQYSYICNLRVALRVAIGQRNHPRLTGGDVVNSAGP